MKMALADGPTLAIDSVNISTPSDILDGGGSKEPISATFTQHRLDAILIVTTAFAPVIWHPSHRVRSTCAGWRINKYAERKVDYTVSSVCNARLVLPPSLSREREEDAPTLFYDSVTPSDPRPGRNSIEGQTNVFSPDEKRKWNVAFGKSRSGRAATVREGYLSRCLPHT